MLEEMLGPRNPGNPSSPGNPGNPSNPGHRADPAPERRSTLTRRRAESDRGAGALEFALILPLLLLVVLALVDFGTMFSQHASLNNGVRDGASKAFDATSGATTCNDILASVQSQLSGFGVDPTKVALRITQDGWTHGSACGNTFQAASFGGHGNNVPCVGSFDAATNTPRSIIVEAQYVSDVPVSVPPFPTTMTLDSTGVYQCELS